jgi:hypothetical protein
MPTRLALTDDQFDQFARVLDADQETAAIIAATLVDDLRPGGVEPAVKPVVELMAVSTGEPHANHADGSADDMSKDLTSTTLLARTITWVPDEGYLRRSGVGLSIASTGWVPAFRAAVSDQLVPVFVHTHPAGHAEFSRWDDEVDASLATAARQFGALAYASVVFAGRSAAPAVVARLCVFAVPRDQSGDDDSALDPHASEETSDGRRSADEPEAEFVEVAAVRVAGSALRLLLPPVHAFAADDAVSRPRVAGDGPDAGTFDRQVRMLGEDGQRTLHAVRAAVIGTGGTGSAVAVQLARLGVGEICLVDDDIVTAPTPTRGHGMRVSDVGKPKVEVLGQHIRDIGLGTRVVEVDATLHKPAALWAIQHADVVFSCVDGHGARLILNRFAYAHLAAVIDLAVLVAVTEPGGVAARAQVEVDERVTWIAPGTACLLCRGRLDAALAYAENLDPDARRRLAGEGYVAAAETPQPAVVTLTTLVASLAATEFLLRLTDIGSSEATELLLRPHIGDLRRNRVPQRPGCFCNDPNYLGRGRRGQYLDLMWTTPPFGEPE